MVTSSFLSKPNDRNLLSSSSFHGLKLSSAFKTQSFSSPSSSSSAPQISISSLRFHPIKESIVSRETTRHYMTDMITYVGGGGADGGLSYAYELSKNPDINVAIIEQSVSPGGGAWLGGQLFSAMIVRKPAHLFLDELEVPYDEQEDYVVIKLVAVVTFTIMSKLLMRPNVKLFNTVAAVWLLMLWFGC